MEKGNMNDLRELANSLDRSIRMHPDAIKHNPDLHAEIKGARDKAMKRYEAVANDGPGPGIATHQS